MKMLFYFKKDGDQSYKKQLHYFVKTGTGIGTLATKNVLVV